MKFSKISWLILVVGILAIAAASLFMLYRQQLQEQQQLNNALATAQNALPKLASERTNLESTLAELEEKLAQATSQLETAKAAFPNSVQSIEVDEFLFRLADDWDLEVTILTATEPSDHTVVVGVENIEVEDVTYLVTTFTVDVKGRTPESSFKTEAEYETYIGETIDDMLNFIHSIVTQRDLNTATVELVNVDIPDPLTVEELEEEGTEVARPLATIRLIIYSYEGE